MQSVRDTGWNEGGQGGQKAARVAETYAGHEDHFFIFDSTLAMTVKRQHQYEADGKLS